MAASHSGSETHDLPINEEGHPVWMSSFSAQTRHELIDDDLFAAKSVIGLVFAVVLGGLTLGAVGVLLSL